MYYFILRNISGFQLEYGNLTLITVAKAYLKITYIYMYIQPKTIDHYTCTCTCVNSHILLN